MKSAVVVIDVQAALFDHAPRPYQADKIVSTINHITTKARSAGIPVIFVQHEQAAGILEFAGEGWKLQQDLEVEVIDKVVRKTTPDAFLRTNLAEILSSNGVTDLIICGYASEFCVDTTTRSAAAQGYSVQLVADGHTTHDKVHATARQIRDHHNATLPDITSFGVQITAVASSALEFAV